MIKNHGANDIQLQCFHLDHNVNKLNNIFFPFISNFVALQQINNQCISLISQYEWIKQQKHTSLFRMHHLVKKNGMKLSSCQMKNTRYTITNVLSESIVYQWKNIIYPINNDNKYQKSITKCFIWITTWYLGSILDNIVHFKFFHGDFWVLLRLVIFNHLNHAWIRWEFCDMHFLNIWFTNQTIL